MVNYISSSLISRINNQTYGNKNQSNIQENRAPVVSVKNINSDESKTPSPKKMPVDYKRNNIKGIE